MKIPIQQKIYSNGLQLLIIVSLSLIFGALGFFYSLLGFFDHPTEKIIPLDAFQALTIKEIGGHFLFGFIVGIPFRKLKVSVLTGLMALTIDSDHLLNINGFHIEGRIDHSIPFAFLSSILMSIIASKIYYKIANANRVTLPSFLPTSSGAITSYNNYSNTGKKNNAKLAINTERHNVLYLSFFFITLAAFLSHISYDALVDNNATFPLLAPFSFNEFVIPGVYSLPIEAAGFVFLFVMWQLYLSYRNPLYRAQQ
jgi:hypothetical protein